MVSWTERFAQLDSAPWPGPRPIARDESHQLKGRDADERAFRTAVLDHLLVVLTADSGVGKTSLLNGRLLPNLQTDGFRTVYISEWHLDGAASPGAFVAEETSRQIDGLKDAPPVEPAYLEDFWNKLDESFGDRLVLVLDQFEELVRYQPSLFLKTLDWLTDLNRTCRIRVVISLRAEYHHQLRQLEASARPFTMTTVRLEPLTAADISDVIDAPSQPISKRAAGAIASAWSSQQDQDDSPGLLHLQGLLYSIHHEVRGDGREEITSADLSNMVDAAGGVDKLFGYGLARAIARKLDHCAAAAVEHGLDRVLVDGTDGMVRRILPNLSSGGFKLVLSEWEIARRALAAEITRSELDDSECRELYQVVKDRFADEEDALAKPWANKIKEESLTTLTDEGGYSWTDWVPWRHDADDLSSGPMLGMPQRLVIEQEMRRFAFALRWLELAAIVRRSAPTPDTTMVALVHDGFGAALERDFQRPRETFSHTIARINGAIGERLSWPSSDIAAHRSRVDGLDTCEPLTLVNVRWRDCSVLGVEFTDIVFANSDFRGTRFEQCRFKGVTFINCLLDNASLSECHIIGSPRLPGVTSKEDLQEMLANGDQRLPNFALTVPAETAEILATYRSPSPAHGTKMLSRTSGLSVHPIKDDDVAGIRWQPALGGLAMFGGRLSSLMLRACAFLPATDQDSVSDRGSISLRHIAGASLDLVEHRGGHLDIVDSTIRGLTVTAPVDQIGAVAGASETTDLDIAFAIMANIWFGGGIQGTAAFNECMIAQLTNCNDDRFQIRWNEDGSDIRVGTHDNVDQLQQAFRSVPPGEPAPTQAFRRMDYRSQPARLELDHGP